MEAWSKHWQLRTLGMDNEFVWNCSCHLGYRHPESLPFHTFFLFLQQTVPSKKAFAAGKETAEISNGGDTGDQQRQGSQDQVKLEQVYPGLADPFQESALRPRWAQAIRSYGLAYHALALSLPRVINIKFPMQPNQNYYITHYDELGFS